MSSLELIKPFQDAQLNEALNHLRRHLVAHNTADVPDTNHLALARSVLNDALEDGVSPDELGAVSLFTARLLQLEGNATASASVMAVTSLFTPWAAEEIQILSAAQLRRTGPLPPGVQISSSDGLNRPLSSLSIRLRSDRMRNTSPERSAELLTDGLRSGKDGLCGDGLALLPVVGMWNERGRELLGSVLASCAATPEGRVARMLSTMVGSLEPSEQQRLHMARRYYEMVEHDSVLRALSPILASSTQEVRCEALWRSAMTYRRSRRASQSRGLYEEMKSDCLDLPEWHMRALYGVGWNQFRDGELTEAEKTFETLAAEYRDSRYADDALFYRIRIAVRQDDLEKARRLLSPGFVEKADGDMIGDSVWRYFQAAIEAGKGEDPAFAEDLELAVQALRDDRSYRSAGRLAWLQASRSSGEERHSKLEAILYDYPLTFAAYLAYSQLAADGADDVLARWQETVDVARMPASEVYFQPVPNRESLQTARVFWAAGWSGLASETLSVATPDDPMTLWLIALGYHLEGRYDLSHDIARRSIDGWRAVLPSPQHRLLWEIAYPLPYFRLVTDSAAEADIEPALVWAIMREESGFRARVESYAHAIGLMQLLESTGSSHARRSFGWDINAEDLKEPHINIPVGAAFLGHLSRKLQPNPVLMAAGYNAGRGAVNGWLKKRDNLPLFQFVEAIPYTQTRDYSKRVNASLFTYQVLYGSGAIEPLPLTLK